MKKLTYFQNNKEFEIGISDDQIYADEFVRTLGANYGSGYSTRYVIDLDINSKKYAEVRISCANSCWACRGHGMNDGWLEANNNILRKEAIKFVDEVKEKIKKGEIEDNTKDVKNLFEKIESFVVENIEDYEEIEDTF